MVRELLGVSAMGNYGYSDLSDLGLGATISLKDTFDSYSGHVYLEKVVDDTPSDSILVDAGLTLDKYCAGSDQYKSSLGVKAGVTYQHDIGNNGYYKLNAALEPKLTNAYKKDINYQYEVGLYPNFEVRHDDYLKMDTIYASMAYGPHLENNSSSKEDSTVVGNIFASVGGEIGVVNGDNSYGVYANVEKSVLGHEFKDGFRYSGGVVYSRSGVFGSPDLGISAYAGVTNGTFALPTKKPQVEMGVSVKLGF